MDAISSFDRLVSWGDTLKVQITKDQLNPNPLDGLPIQKPRPFSDFWPDQGAITIHNLTYHPSYIFAELTIDGVNYEVSFLCSYDEDGKKEYWPRSGWSDQPIYKRTNQEAIDQFAEFLTNQNWVIQ